MDLCGLESPAQALAFQQLGGAPQQFQPGVFRRGLLSTKSWISHGSHQLWTAYPPGLFERRQPQFLDLLQALLGRTTQLCCHGFSSSVSWPINEKVNQSIKLVINRSITKKISESQGISWNLCLLWLLWLELGGFLWVFGCESPMIPQLSRAKKRPPPASVSGHLLTLRLDTHCAEWDMSPRAAQHRVEDHANSNTFMISFWAAKHTSLCRAGNKH